MRVVANPPSPTSSLSKMENQRQAMLVKAEAEVQGRCFAAESEKAVAGSLRKPRRPAKQETQRPLLQSSLWSEAAIIGVWLETQRQRRSRTLYSGKQGMVSGLLC